MTKYILYMDWFEEPLGVFDTSLEASNFWYDNGYKGSARVVVNKDGRNVTGWRLY